MSSTGRSRFLPGYYTPMRIVVLGAGGARKTETSIVRAARSLGHECRLVNVVGWSRYAGPWSSRIASYRAEAFEPDFVLLTRHAIELGEPSIRSLLRNRPGVFWYFDLEPKEKVLQLGRLVGKMYVTYLGQVDTYQAAGIDQVQFLPQAMDPGRDLPAAGAPHQYHCDVSFVGSGDSSYRYDVLRAVSAVSRLQIRGPGWRGAPSDLPVAGGPVYGKRLARVIRGAAISLGASSYPGQDTERFSASNRMWSILGCGGFYLGRYVQGIESFAADGKHCAWYRSPAEAAELVRHYLNHPAERDRIAQAGHDHALAHHTYAHRLQLLLAGKGYPLPTIL
jgi:spore maturation protein CgeB